MKRAIGFALLIGVVLILFAATAATHGIVGALFAWGMALALTVMVAVGAYLAFDN